MLRLLDALSIWGVLILFIVFILGSIFLLRYLLKSFETKSRESAKDSDLDPKLLKKYPLVDINKYGFLIGNIGAILSLAVVLAAFEFPLFEEQELVNLGNLDSDIEEMIEIPPTEQKPPPPPKIKQPEIVEIPDEEEIEEEIEIELDVEIDEETVVEEIIETEEVEEENVNEIFEVVEEGAEPKMGYKNFYAWVGKNISYPRQAKRMGVEGKVIVQFVVEKNGKLTDVKVLRGQGAGLDEEAVRVLKMADAWKPGKQRGRAVRQRMVIPIHFQLR